MIIICSQDVSYEHWFLFLMFGWILSLLSSFQIVSEEKMLLVLGPLPREARNNINEYWYSALLIHLEPSKPSQETAPGPPNELPAKLKLHQAAIGSSITPNSVHQHPLVTPSANALCSKHFLLGIISWMTVVYTWGLFLMIAEVVMSLITAPRSQAEFHH